ncbi:MAG: threonine ammonia-lyase [Gaiellaceae bacterium]
MATPLERWEDGVYLKREDAHELGAFKWRGALAVLEARPEDVVTASTGNQGAAVAWAAKRLGVRATVFVPARVSRAKLALLHALDADVRQTGADFDEAKDAAVAFAREHDLHWFEDGADEAQLEGYSQIGREIVEQLGAQPAAVIAPVGNGALFAGVARGPDESVRKVAVAAAAAPVMYESWQAGRVVESNRSETIADGLAVRVAVPEAVAWLNECVDEFLLVSESALQQSVARFWTHGIRVEPAAAATLAALPHVGERPVVLVVTGRNVDDDVFAACLAAAT